MSDKASKTKTSTGNGKSQKSRKSDDHLVEPYSLPGGNVGVGVGSDQLRVGPFTSQGSLRNLANEVVGDSTTNPYVLGLGIHGSF